METDHKPDEVVSKATGFVLGAYTASDGSLLRLTALAGSFDGAITGNLSKLLKKYPLTKDIKSRLFYDLHPDFTHVCVVDIGPESAAFNTLEEYDQKKENVRQAIAIGVTTVVEAGALEVILDSCGDEESTAEASNLVTFRYDEFKRVSSKRPKVHVRLFGGQTELWILGSVKANAQNFARYLMETPTNYSEPSHFVEKVSEKLKDLNTRITIREKEWVQQQGMGAFLSVARGSHVAPLLLDIRYDGANGYEDPPIVFVGKGITFNSGGISANMDKMRADMGSAAVVVATMYAAASLSVRLNLRGIVLLTACGGVVKPGDVVFAMNKKSIQVDSSNEGSLILADGLCYAQSLNPKFIVDLGTLPGTRCVALGAGVTGVFSNDTGLFSFLHEAGSNTGDRVWRLPLFEYYAKQMKNSDTANVKEISENCYGGSCTAAAFLRQFVGDSKWLHLDISGVVKDEDDSLPYIPKGMTGRPTRTLIEFLLMMEMSG